LNLWRKRAACLLVAGLCIFLLGEDVEHDPVVIEAPIKKQNKPARPKKPLLIPPVLDLKPPPVPRYYISLPGPKRLKLELPLTGPEQKKQKPSEVERISQGLQVYLKDLDARWVAQRGQHHPAWHELTGRIEHAWKPNITQIRDAQIVEPSAAWLSAEFWQRMKDAPPSIGDTFQNPIDHPLYAGKGDWVSYMSPVLEKPKDKLPADPRLEQSRFNSFVALVEIRFGEPGEAPGASLVEGSGHPLYDRAALAGVEKALDSGWLEDLPPGPTRAVYALFGQVNISSVLPIAGLGADLVLPLLDPVIPTSKGLSTRVELVSLHHQAAKEKEQ
jgi:hypothetical protein